MPERTCTACGADISHRIASALTCSNACSKWRRRRGGAPRGPAAKTCGWCGSELIGMKLNALYCTRVCKTAASQQRRPDEKARNADRYAREKNHRVAYAVERFHKYRAPYSPGVSERDWLRLCARFGNCCAYCGVSAPLTMDHVVPIARGGKHSIGNLLPACMPCNASKSTRFLSVWKRLPRREGVTFALEACLSRRASDARLVRAGLDHGVSSGPGS